jgi:hypothetical protein
MIRLSLSVAVCLFLSPSVARAGVITFEDLSLSGSNTYQNGATLNPPGSFTSGGATFNNSYNANFGVWSGWSYSNVVDNATAGFTNQYAAFNPSGGDASAQYGVANAFSPGDATIALPAGQIPVSMRVVNTTYAALSMKNGDQFAKKFGGASGNDPDFFLLTITGKNAQNQSTGSVDFYLADFRFANNQSDYIVSQWTTVDLSKLGAGTSTLSFGLNSSDVGAFGMNTPAYFAMDNLQLTAIPEPSSLTLVAFAVGAFTFRARRVFASERRHDLESQNQVREVAVD